MNFQVLIGSARDLADLALPVLTGVGLTGLFIVALAQFTGMQFTRPLWLVPMSFGVLGGITGAIAGSSSEPLVSALTTGIIGIVTALLSYFFAQESNSPAHAAVPFMIIMLLLNCLIGLSVGQNWKRKWDDFGVEMEWTRVRRDQVWAPAVRKYQVGVTKKCLEQAATYVEARDSCAYQTLFPQ